MYCFGCADEQADTFLRVPLGLTVVADRGEEARRHRHQKDVRVAAYARQLLDALTIRAPRPRRWASRATAINDTSATLGAIR